MADTWNLTPNFSGFDKNNGQERTQGMDTGDEGKLRAVVPWLEWGGALTATYADYVTQGANIGISKAQDKIRDAQLESALTSEMSAGRDASKMRKEALRRSIDKTILKNALSGLTAEGTALAAIEEDSRRSAEDEAAQRANIALSGSRMKSQRELDRVAAEGARDEMKMQQRTSLVGSIPALIQTMPLL